MTDGDGHVKLACQEPAATSCKPSNGLDLLRAVGKFAERLPPWFWERVAYRPGPFRQPFLELIRRLSSAPHLPELRGLGAQPGATLIKKCDVLVVGGGMSGLVAAVTLAEGGRNVTLVNTGPLGGSALCRPGDASEAAKWIGMARDSVAIHEQMTCVGLYANGKRAWCVGSPANLSIEFGTIVIATGAYDKFPTISGNDTPGIVGIRAFEQLAAKKAIPRRMRVVAYGTDAEIGRAVTAAVASQVEIALVASPARSGAGRFPSRNGVTIEKVSGNSRGLTGVRFSDGSHEHCDLLVICESQPTYELQAQAGASVGLRGSGSTLCAQEGPEAMLVVGEAAGWFDPSNSVGRTREHVTTWITQRTKPKHAPWTMLEPATAPPLPGDAFACVCEDVRVRDVHQAIADGYTDIELVKRHTGAGTGPCQGKLCHGTMLACAAQAGLEIRIPTPRPLIRPIVLTRLVPSSTAHE